MDPSELSLRTVDASDLSSVAAVLERNDLPAEDVHAGPATFYVASVPGRTGADDGGRAAGGGRSATVGDGRSSTGGERVGVGGLERYGSDALLRSVVVEAPVRGRGYGTALCDALEDRARADGVEVLYLLTTTAADFFADRGYDEIPRERAPSPIRETTQFAERCPASATCLRTVL